MERFCGAAWRARGPTALMGRVRDAESGNPAVGAKVSLVWYEIDVASGPIRRSPRVREATVGPDGIYRICGLPAELKGRAQVIRGGLTSGDVPVTFGADVTPPTRASGAIPVYPPAALERGLEGSPVVEIWIDEKGNVMDVAILESAGAMLDGAVLEAVAGWKFTPASVNGTPVSVRMTLQHLFRR